MAKKPTRRNYIRQWRIKRKLSLRKLASRLETEPGGELIASHATIGRIEQGKQEWSEDILRAIAAELGVTLGDLLDVNPEKEGQVIDLLRRLDDAKLAQATEYIRFLASR